jgi:hypothetical protein
MGFGLMAGERSSEHFFIRKEVRVVETGIYIRYRQVISDREKSQKRKE